MTPVPLYCAIAQLMATIERCKSPSANESQRAWVPQHEARLEHLIRCYLPSGSGIDSGTKLLVDECKSNRLVLQADFHHMDQHGSYSGWTEHQVVITPSLAYGAVIRITGRDRNAIKDYLADVFDQALRQLVEV
jgi:hypothetical protein